MRRLLKFTGIILTVLMVSSSVWAFNYTNHNTQAPNEKGDLLIFPWFMTADGSWNTKFTVINTDQQNCVVAKLVIRSHVKSSELLDFFLYLSPADVWTGTIVYSSAKKQVVIRSSDDSAVQSLDFSKAPPAPTWASKTPIDQSWLGTICPGDDGTWGYVEVIGIAAGVSNTGPGMSKDKIYNGYYNLVNGTVYTPAEQMFLLSDLVNLGYPRNVLAGYQNFQADLFDAKQSALLRAVALKDYQNTERATTSAETRLGTDSSNNSLAEIEAALSKDNIAQPYLKTDVDSTVHFFTFPTKLSRCTGNPDSPYFLQNATSVGCINYHIRTYDLTETFPKSGSPFSGDDPGDVRSLCGEVNYLQSLDFEYTEGWAVYDFFKSDNQSAPFTAGLTDSGLPLGYDGTPVIPTFVNLGEGGLTASYAAWTDTLVYGAASRITSLVDYQYTDK